MVARYNPCGAFVDVGHSPYTVRARLYPDSDQVFDLVWYECKPDAPVLPYPSAINSLYQEGDRDDWLPTVVGEILGTAHTYHETRRKNFALGTHQCGTAADFAGDGVIDLNPPFVEYRKDQLPFCCGPVFIEAAEGGVQFFNWDTGGFQIGGSCPADVYTITSARGGVQLGGAPGIVAYLPYPSLGGVEVGGSAAIVAYLPYPSAGGVEVGGACGAVVIFAGGALGGVEVGGEFGVVPSWALPAGGGAEVGGAAGFVTSLPVPAAGGHQLGGAAGGTARLPVPAAGGWVMGGAAGFAVRVALPAAGGGAIGGAAGVVFTPPPPTPGSTCATAATLTLSTTYNYTIANTVQHWFKVSTTTGAARQLIFSTTGGAIVYSAYEAAGCPPGMPFSSASSTGATVNRTSTGNDFIFVQFVGQPTTGGYSVRIN